MTAAANTATVPTQVRRQRAGIAPSHRAGPTRWGSSAGALDTLIEYSTKIEIRITESISVTECFRGRVSE